MGDKARDTDLCLFLRKKVLSSILNERKKDLRMLRGRCLDGTYMGPELPRDDQAADTDL